MHRQTMRSEKETSLESRRVTGLQSVRAKGASSKLDAVLPLAKQLMTDAYRAK
jgi:hypothetical protein